MIPKTRFFICAFVFGYATNLFAAGIDSLAFGNTADEHSHQFIGTRNQVITGGLGESAQRLLPGVDKGWEGGRLAFVLNVDPEKQNYVTVRLWGSDATDDQLTLFCEGEQVGYRHLGDIELLDLGGGAAPFPGRFVYKTLPLPLGLTRGKTNLDFEIHASGPTWAYGDTFDKFQKPMTVPTGGIYNVCIHTETCFIPPVGEKQGEAMVAPPVRSSPGPEVLDKLEERVSSEVRRLLQSTRPLDEMQMEFLARAYFVKWTPAFQNPGVVERVATGMDALFTAWRANPELDHDDSVTPNPGWFEFGPAGHAVSLLGEQMKPLLDVVVQYGDKKASRRAAWSELLLAGRDWHRHHRRLYTNQSMITDMEIYLSNRGLQVVDPAQAFSEAEARRYLYEALALQPWRDSDDQPGWGVGTNYWQLTAKHLTKELGYVGYYGEVLDWVASIYNATRPSSGQAGDEKIKSQLEKIADARAVFRYPGVDEDGFRAMRIEAVVGWRDPAHYPGDVTYGERATWDASPLYAAAATLDKNAIGYAKQMFADGQFFISLNHQMAQNGSLRVTAGLLDVPDQYELLKSQPPVTKCLPMTPGQPDFVFSDEEDGVVAVKNGDEIFYASLYWRARNAVNFLARVHFTTPKIDRIAIVREEAQFTPDGQFYIRPDGTGGATPGGVHYPANVHSAETGERLPIAKIPDGVKFRPGQESIFAGKADFYTLHYGNYLVGMNMTGDRTFEMKTPGGTAEVKELVSGKTVAPATLLKVAPRSTVVLCVQEGKD